MSRIQVHPGSASAVPLRGEHSGYPESRAAEEEIRPSVIWRMALRRRWTFLACIALGVMLAVLITHRSDRLYEASATIRIDDKEPNLPEVFRTLSTGGEVATEAEVLRSRALAQDVTDSLALQLRLLEPRRVERGELLESIRVDRLAPSARYRLRRRPDGRFDLFADSLGQRLLTVTPGDRVRLNGTSFRLRPAATSYKAIAFAVQPYNEAVDDVLDALRVSQLSRETKILRVRYEAPDPQLASQVPNLIVDRFVARRREVLHADARGSVDFLRKQIDSVATQLSAGEEKLRRFRERTGVIDPAAEANSQVTRLIASQTERSSVNSEREALSTLLAQVDAKAARLPEGSPSPYRELLAFPTLLRNAAARELLQSLAQVEQERTALLARRKASDLDVQALTARIDELQGQLRAVVATYLEGLTNQVATLDTTLAQFGRQLGSLPSKQLEVARLEREPRVLGEIYSLLQTRLKEAEIAGAAEDPSVRIVDRAVAPRLPSKPNPFVNLFAGLAGGLMLGLTVAFVREARDRAVHTRGDVQLATGLPVLGLIPSIARRSRLRGAALIAEKRTITHAAAICAAATDSAATGRPRRGLLGGARRAYTFLGEVQDSLPEAASEAAPAPVAPPAEVLQLSVPKLGAGASEAYDMLQTNLVFSRPDAAVKILVVTSALPGDGKTSSAINLAVTLSRRDLKVLLIDADLRRPVVHKVFEVSRDPGLKDVLQGSVTFSAARRAIAVDHGESIHFLTAGTPTPNPSGLLESEQMRALLVRLREVYDAIIMDSPPANVVTDAALLGAQADGVLVVARAGVTEAGALTYAVDQLHHLRERMLGVLLNDIDKRDAAYDPDYRYHDYSSYLSSPSE